MRWAALLALAAPALAENAVVLEGYQFRLLWPATGALSPDLIAEQAGQDQPGVFCGEAAFANGDSWQDLGAPFRGLLLVGVRGVGDQPNRTGAALFTLAEGDTVTELSVHAHPGELVWYPVGFYPVEVSLHRLRGGLDGDLQPLPRVFSSCNE
ncbi:hypothetical protein [Nioella sp. MMSF_3534]|uniref:hypothetical protein n=1 Tax=Nioella sp. MMSF_3534 TaxID=3046720 RepID=UPI00273EDE06|nr:hypothetical protein [Nioella sp. MMSF_3534]